MDLTCPQCGQQQVRKVSGIYKEQGRFSPPEKPEYERVLPENSMHTPVLHLLGHLVGYPMAIGFIFLFTFLACSTTAIGAATGAGMGWFLFLLGVALLTWWLVRKTRATAAARRDVVDEAYPRWQKAYQRWDRLYYCQVCDRQFIPNGQSQVMTEEEATRYVYVYVD